jgi:GNAT superfamily N-acetyltransferase
MSSRATWARIHSPNHTVMPCRRCRWATGGFALCVMHEGTWVTKPICYLEDLYVDAQQRGRGAGRALIEAIRQEGERAAGQNSTG